MRPSAAYVGSLSHPIRLAVNKGLAGRDTANFLSINDALELATDLTSAIAHALQAEREQQAITTTPSRGNPP